MALEKITEEQMDTYGVCAAPDILSGTAAENKNLFDRMTRQLVVPVLNACIEAISQIGNGGGGGGVPGADGFSPVVEISKTDGVTTLKITDKAGVHTSEIEDGADGVSPSVEIKKTGKVTTLTITDAEGEHSVNINDGADGMGTGGVGLPPGGAAGQVLAKTSGTDYNAGWITLSESGGRLISAIDFSRWEDNGFDVTYADGVTFETGTVEFDIYGRPKRITLGSHVLTLTLPEVE